VLQEDIADGLFSKMANVADLIKSPTFLAKLLELVSRKNCTYIYVLFNLLEAHVLNKKWQNVKPHKSNIIFSYVRMEMSEICCKAFHSILSMEVSVLCSTIHPVAYFNIMLF
jgi:hypothetical protein